MKALLIPVFLLLLVDNCFAQRQNVYYLKNDGRHVDVLDSADFIRIIREPDSASTLYNVLEYYKHGEKKLIGKSSSIDPPIFEEQCITFYKNGKKKNLGIYKNGRLVGTDYEFYPNGHIYLEKEYPDNDNPYNAFDNNLIIKSEYDSVGTILIKNGTGYYKGYDDKFTHVNEEGAVKDGKRDSLWKGADNDTKFTETYSAGVLISGTATGKDGKIINYVGKRGVPPSFKGGLNAFYQYISSSVNYPYDARKNNIEGKVFINFVVGENGQISDVKVVKSVSPSIDKEAVRVIKNSPLWTPGTMFGRPVRCSYSVPLAFKLRN
jgi:TonB family protein